MSKPDEVAGTLRRLRVEKGLTQDQLAAPRYTGAYVSTIEAGRRIPSDKALHHFAAKLGVDPDELATGVPSGFEADAVLRMQEGWRALYQGRYADAKKVFRQIDRECRRIHRDHVRGRALVGLARCLEREGQSSDALEGFKEALQVLANSAPLPAQVEAVAGIARCHQMAGDTRLAAHVLETYLLDMEREDLLDPSALMRTYASLVWPYMELGLGQKARDAAQQALRLQSRVEDPEEVAGMHMNVARALLSDGRADAALESLRKAEEIYLDLQWSTELARARTNRGMVYIEAGEFVAAKDELHAALAIFQQVGFARGEGRTLNELARVERTLGKTKLAESHARRAVELLAEMEAVPELALAHRELALAIRESKGGEAQSHFRKAIDLYRECGEALHAADTHRLLGDLLANTHSGDGCKEYRAGLDLVAEGLDRRDN